MEENGLNKLALRCHAANQTWWADLNLPQRPCGRCVNRGAVECDCSYCRGTGYVHPRKQRNIGELLMLCVSELAEAMEGHRKNLPDDKLPHRSMFEVELADCLIRIFDIAGALNLDLAGAFEEKMAYNATRADHKIEHRLAEGGKKY